MLDQDHSIRQGLLIRVKPRLNARLLFRSQRYPLSDKVLSFRSLILLMIGLSSRMAKVTKGGYSVVTGSSDPCNKASNVCHGNVAHLTRAGYSQTPANTASFPSSSISTCSPVAILWNNENRC